MEDKCANMAKECLGCAHHSQEYHEYPCSECEHNGGEYKMYFPAAEMNAILAKDELPKIKDSGERRVFETGAVRDCAEGKGRCDLLPLGVIAAWMNSIVLAKIAMFVKTHDTSHLRIALDYIAEKHFSCKADLVIIFNSLLRVVLRDPHHVRLGQLCRAVLGLPGLDHPKCDDRLISRRGMW